MTAGIGQSPLNNGPAQRDELIVFSSSPASFPQLWRAVGHVAPAGEVGATMHPTILAHGGLLWLFVTRRMRDTKHRHRLSMYSYAGPQRERHAALELFFAEAASGPWHRHPQSPVARGPFGALGGGAFIKLRGDHFGGGEPGLLRHVQD